jgi:hypothetical protein
MEAEIDKTYVLNESNWTINCNNCLSNANETWSNDSISIDEVLTLILPYAVILLLSVIGNTLVIVTLGVDSKMHTVTNLFLLNLAISDLLLGVFCMPFTLVGNLLREFIFGSLMCRLVPYLQGMNVMKKCVQSNFFVVERPL